MTDAPAAPAVEPFDAVDVIRAKRDGHRLADDQIDWVIDAYTRGVVADQQMAALAMAIFLHGMDRHEIARWTNAMIEAGERMDFSVRFRAPQPTSTRPGEWGTRSPCHWPRWLPHTAWQSRSFLAADSGTPAERSTRSSLSPAGTRISLTRRCMAQLDSGSGAMICAAGSGLAPADKKLYALRDITSTVEAIPLIATSIMSKKIAEGTAGSLVWTSRLDPVRS